MSGYIKIFLDHKQRKNYNQNQIRYDRLNAFLNETHLLAGRHKRFKIIANLLVLTKHISSFGLSRHSFVNMLILLYFLGNACKLVIIIDFIIKR